MTVNNAWQALVAESLARAEAAYNANPGVPALKRERDKWAKLAAKERKFNLRTYGVE